MIALRMVIAFLLFISTDRGIFAQEDEFSLGSIEIVGKKLEISSGRLDDERIDELQSVDIGDALRKDMEGVGGIRRTGIAIDPVVRGLSKDRVNVLVDKGSVYGACANRMDPPTFHISPWEAEAIEVKKGAFDVTYGPSVLAGALNVKTKEPEYSQSFKFSKEARVGFEGDSGSFKEGLSIEADKAPFGFRLSSDYKKNNGYRDGRGKRLTTDFRQVNLSTKLYYFLEEDKRISFSYLGQRARDVFYPTLAMDSPKDDLDMVSLDARFDEPKDGLKDVEFKVYSSWVNHEMENDSKFDYAFTGPTMWMKAPSQSRTYGVRLKGELDILDGLDAGMDYYNRFWDITMKRWSLAGMPMADIRSIPEAVISDFGLFAQPRKKFGDFELITGSRVDFVNAKASAVGQAEKGYFNSVYGSGASNYLDKSETNYSGFLKGSYDLGRDAQLYTAVGRGVRTADPRERFRVLLPISGNKRDIGNPNLKPEESLQYEVGAKAKLGRFNGNLSIFRNEIENYIVQYDSGITSGSLGVTPSQPVMGYRNVDVRLYGAEVSAGFALVEGLSIMPSFSYVRGENKTEDKPLPEIPPLRVRLGIRHDNLEKRFWIELVSILSSAQHRYDSVVDPGKTEGFSVFDLRMGWRPKDNILMSFGIENLFDRYYSEHTSKTFAFNQDGYTIGDRIPEPGRNVYMNVTLKF